MRLTFEDKYRIRTFDPLNLCIEIHTKVKQKDGTSTMCWVIEGYYTNLSSALRWLLVKRINRDSSTSVKGLLKSLERFMDEIKTKA